MKVLVVDDVTINRVLVEQVLESEGYTVVSAGGGQEALDQLAEDTGIDVVLCDLLMPDMDGVDVYKEYLRRGIHGDQSIDIPFILLTAAQNIGRLQDAKDIGFTDILTKPPDYERLKTILADFAANRTRKKLADTFDTQLKSIEELTTSVIEAKDVESARILYKALDQARVRLRKVTP